MPAALYWKGLCYDLGFGVEKNPEKVREYMAASAAAGNPGANAYLGDYYFASGDFDKALGYYTEIGAIALNPQRQKNVQAILAAKPQNFQILWMSGILLVLEIIFNIFLGQGMFCKPGAISNVVWAVISSLLSAAVYGLFCWQYFFQKKKHNRCLWAPTAMMLVLLCCTFFAIL